MSSHKISVIAVIAFLSAFCFVTVLSDGSTATTTHTYTALRQNSNSNSNSNRNKNLSYQKVTAYRCDEDNREITAVIDNSTETLEEFGLPVRICFQATPQATFNDLFLLKVDDFVFTKDRTDWDLSAAGPTRQIPMIIRQKAVDHGTATSTDLTELLCDPGSEICALKTTLTGYFFLTSGTIRGKGSVLMQRGKGGRQRQLEQSDLERDIDLERERELQHIDTFEDVYIELTFIGDGRVQMSPKRRIIVVVVSIIAFLSCCCCGIIYCMSICVGDDDDDDDKKYDSDDDDDVEAVPVVIEWASTSRYSAAAATTTTQKKNGDDTTDDEEDLSETVTDTDTDTDTKNKEVVKKSKRKSKRNSDKEEENTKEEYNEKKDRSSAVTDTDTDTKKKEAVKKSKRKSSSSTKSKRKK